MLLGVTSAKATKVEKSAPRKAVPELPAWKAFVVQFTREADAESGIFAGRVEHLSSGRRARFTSADELVAILRKLVAELGRPAHGEKGN